MNQEWFPYSQTNTEGDLRLFCFPYAGANASLFRRWFEELPDSVEVMPVELPGRGARFGEPPFTALPTLVEKTAQALRCLLGRPYAFFGHSMGALIGFELSRYFRRLHLPQPLQLFVSGHSAPQLPREQDPIHSLPDEQFFEELKKLNGTPEEVLENRELMELISPLLRADFAVCETYVYQPEPPLDFPITVFGGLEDDGVTRERLEPWREQTTSSFLLHVLPGDHFFLQASEKRLLELLVREISQLLTCLV